MTIIVGIVCENGIVVASDSQSTMSNTKRTDSSKISELWIAGKPVLVAQAGDCIMSSKAVENLENLFKTSAFDDYRKPADIAQEAISQTKKDLVTLNHWEQRPDLVENYLFENPFTLMLAYYYHRPDSKPESYLYVINSVPGFATRYTNYSAIGCGGTVGEFILGRCQAHKLPTPEALIAAIYTVEEVKKVDAFCGGPTKAAVVNWEKVITSESDSSVIVKCAVEAMQNYEDETQESWRKLMRVMIKKINKRYKKIYAEADPESDDKAAS